MDQIFEDFGFAYNRNNGTDLAKTITPVPPSGDPARLYNFLRSSNQHSIQTDLRYKLQYNPDLKLNRNEANAWLEVFAAFYKCITHLVAAEEATNAGHPRDADWSRVYDAWKEVVNALHKGYTGNHFLAWTIPCLYTAGKYLRVFAIKADENAASQRDSGISFGALQEEDVVDPASRHEKLEDAARQINRLFSLCVGDRNPIEESRKWALYGVANLLFKTYFKLNSISLSKNILKSLHASTGDMPPLSAFPSAHQVTFNYYCGVIHFLEEDYNRAEEHFVSALEKCDSRSTKNLQLILTYLIPTRMLTSHRLPSKALLAPYPQLQNLFGPIIDAIRNADLAAFNAAMEAGEAEFVKRRIYLTLERGKDITLRNLFRKLFIAGGFDPPKEDGPALRRTRVPVQEFAAALRLSGADVDDGNEGIDMDAVECLIANAMYKNLMKGYIARERGIVVLGKSGAFPGTGV